MLVAVSAAVIYTTALIDGWMANNEDRPKREVHAALWCVAISADRWVNQNCIDFVTVQISNNAMYIYKNKDDH